MVKVSIIIDYGVTLNDRYEKKEWEFEDDDEAYDLYFDLISYVCLPEHEIKEEEK